MTTPEHHASARDAPTHDAPGRQAGGHAHDDLPGWVGRLARGRWGIGVLSGLESTVVPIPLEAILIPLMVSHPRRAWTLALAAWVGCLIGSLLFYFVGALLYDPVVAPALAALGLEAPFEDVRARLDEGTSFFVAVLLISVSPAPMQLATLGAGAVGGPVVLFLSAIALSRGARYFGLALLAGWLGHRLERMRVRKRWVLLGTLAVLVLGYGAYQVLM